MCSPGYVPNEWKAKLDPGGRVLPRAFMFHDQDQPMLDVLNLLRENEFRTYIVSGGGQGFIRSYAEDVRARNFPGEEHTYEVKD